MSRESRVIISRLIVVVVFIISLLAMALGDFFITLITVSGGLIVWLLYLLAADLRASQEARATETSFGKTLSRVVAGLGGVLAISAFMTYGMEQTMWGSYTFNLAGLALALAVLVVMLLPLIVLELAGKKPEGLVAPRAEVQVPPPEAEQPPSVTALPEQQLYYGTPYPPGYEPYGLEPYPGYEEDEDWEETEELEEDEDYYEDEEDYEDEEEAEEEEGEDEDLS
ncbi:MAG: hypothetical protein ACETWG_02310 [Candidatus Neomarinimicrobiota bacterium]